MDNVTLQRTYCLHMGHVKALEREAQQRGVSVSVVVREALDEYLFKGADGHGSGDDS